MSDPGRLRRVVPLLAALSLTGAACDTGRVGSLDTVGPPAAEGGGGAFPVRAERLLGATPSEGVVLDPRVMAMVTAAAAAAAGRPRYLGVTTTARAGDAGFPTLNADCVAAFPASRICTDMEVFGTIPFPTPGEDAWVIHTAGTEDPSVVSTSHTASRNPFGVTIVNDPNYDQGDNCSYRGAWPSDGGTTGLFNPPYSPDPVTSGARR